MRSMLFIILLAFVEQAHVKKLMVDKILDKLVHRALQTWPRQLTDLDHATLAKTRPVSTTLAKPRPVSTSYPRGSRGNIHIRHSQFSVLCRSFTLPRCAPIIYSHGEGQNELPIAKVVIRADSELVRRSMGEDAAAEIASAELRIQEAAAREAREKFEIPPCFCLLPALSEKVFNYDPTADVAAINRAYVYAVRAHGTQRRQSGEPFFTHPLAVAGILSDMRLETATIITALLHDTVEDTSATLDEIRQLFGEDICTLVDGVTKLEKCEVQSESTKQAENFGKLVLAMSNDVRVLLVKLADRLHNMRTLHYVNSEEKRKRKARETLEIFAPLAERIGIHNVKDELEDLSFQQLHPHARESIVARLNYWEEEGGKAIVQDIIKQLTKTLEDQGVKAEIIGRMKTPYSIWRKMRKRSISFQQLSDIMAFRVLVESLGHCYATLGILHVRYRVIPGRFKDYISTPKPNKYQSLHTTLVGPNKQKIEVQIRTSQMHEIAEFGLAADWQYKQGVRKRHEQDYRWLGSLLEILEHASNPEEFFEHTKLEMSQDQVIAFTPLGDSIALPRGATTIDFAYAIHSKVGDHCVGAKINGRMMPFKTVLQSGDQVEILTAKWQTPSPTWEEFVVTGKARTHIRKFIRIQRRARFAKLGLSILQKAFGHENLGWSEKLLESHRAQFKATTTEDLYALIGEGEVSVHDVIRNIYPQHNLKRKQLKEEGRYRRFPKVSDVNVSLRGLPPGTSVHYGGCCRPLPRDKIVGITVNEKSVTIHNYDCENLNNFVSQPERWIDVGWNIPSKDPEFYVGRLQVVILNQPGALASLTSIISEHNGDITNLEIVSRSYDFFDVLVDVEVERSEHLKALIVTLRMSQFVRVVERAPDKPSATQRSSQML